MHSSKLYITLCKRCGNLTGSFDDPRDKPAYLSYSDNASCNMAIEHFTNDPEESPKPTRCGGVLDFLFAVEIPSH